MGKQVNKTPWTPMKSDAQYAAPGWWYVIRWRIGTKWRQRGFPKLEEAERCLANMRAQHEHFSVYRDHDFDAPRFAGEADPPKTAAHPHPGGPRAKRYVVRWCFGRKGRMRNFATKEEAMTFHHQLWATEVHTGKLFISHRIWFRVN